MLPLRRVGLVVLALATALLVPGGSTAAAGPDEAPAAARTSSAVVCGDAVVGGGWSLAAQRLAADCDAPLRELGRHWREQQLDRGALSGS